MFPALTPVLFWTVAAVINNAQHVDVSADVRALVAAEHAFAHAVAKDGIQAGFLAYLADDAMLFRPGPVAGKEWMKSRPPSKGWLGWEPVFADAARSGDIGYTTGPWSFRPKGVTDRPTAFGEYITVWRKQPDGTWKVEFDGGVSHPAPAASPKKARPGALTQGGRVLVRPSSDPDSARAEILAAEQALAAAVSARGAGKAYAELAAPDVRLFRDGAFPLVGIAAVQRLFDAASPRPTWTVTDAHLSAASDLAYVHGSYQTTGETGAFLRIWKRVPSGGFRIVLDLTSPAPPPAKS